MTARSDTADTLPDYCESVPAATMQQTGWAA
jgi:hypothetical protein